MTITAVSQATDPDRADFLITGGDEDVVASGNAASATISITIPGGSLTEQRVIDVFARDAGSGGIPNTSCSSEGGPQTTMAIRDYVNSVDKRGVTTRQPVGRRQQVPLYINVHPNPVHDALTIGVNRKLSGTQTVMLTSVMGAMYEFRSDPVTEKSSTSLQTNLKGIPAGVYFVCLNYDGEVSCESIIIY